MTENPKLLPAKPGLLFVTAVQTITLDVNEDGVVGTLHLRNVWGERRQTWDLIARLDGTPIISDRSLVSVTDNADPKAVSVARKYATYFDQGIVAVDEPELGLMSPIENPRAWVSDDGLVEVRYRISARGSWRFDIENPPTWRASGGPGGGGGNGKITRRTISDCRVEGAWEPATASWQLRTEIYHSSLLKNGRLGKSEHLASTDRFPELREQMLAMVPASGVRVRGVHD